MMRDCTAATLIVVASIACTLSSASSTPAFAKCTSTPQYNGQPRADDNQTYQAGREQLASTSGIYSDMLNYSPWVQPDANGSHHVASAWVMLDSNGQAQNGGWAQIGWWEYPGSVRHTFTQTYDPITIQSPTHLYTGFYSPQPVGTYTDYKVTQAYSGSQLFAYYYLSNSLIEQEPVQFPVYRATADSEINTLASQMAGGYNSSNHEVFSNTHILVSGQWQAMSNSTPVNYNPTYFGEVTTSSTYHMTWDKDCAS